MGVVTAIINEALENVAFVFKYKQFQQNVKNQRFSTLKSLTEKQYYEYVAQQEEEAKKKRNKGILLIVAFMVAILFLLVALKIKR
jgi:uncharacterized ion transporter superfamily protein YfcC